MCSYFVQVHWINSTVRCYLYVQIYLICALCVLPQDLDQAKRHDQMFLNNTTSAGGKGAAGGGGQENHANHAAEITFQILPQITTLGYHMLVSAVTAVPVCFLAATCLERRNEGSGREEREGEEGEREAERERRNERGRELPLPLSSCHLTMD